MIYLDLDEKPPLPSWLFGLGRPALFSFMRKDYHRPELPELKKAVHLTLHEKAGLPLDRMGAVRVLTQPRTFGFSFNPVSFYYIYDLDDQPLGVVAEINNTPWNERFSYGMAWNGEDLEASFSKDFHVSPFMPMDQLYHWRFSQPSESLRVHMENEDPREARLFSASLQLERRALSAKALTWCAIVHPFCTIKTLVAIYWHALVLKLKGAPFFEHPRYLEAEHVH